MHVHVLKHFHLCLPALGPVDVNWFDSISVSEFNPEKSEHEERCQESEGSESQSQSLLKRHVKNNSKHIASVSIHVNGVFKSYTIYMYW